MIWIYVVITIGVILSMLLEVYRGFNNFHYSWNWFVTIPLHVIGLLLTWLVYFIFN